MDHLANFSVSFSYSLIIRIEGSQQAIGAGVFIAVFFENHNSAALFVAEGFGAGLVKAFAKGIFALQCLAQGGIDEEALHIFGLFIHAIRLDLLDKYEGVELGKAQALHAGFFGLADHDLLLLGRISLGDIGDGDGHSNGLLIFRTFLFHDSE